MRYAAFAGVLIGVLSAGYAGYQYASGGPPGDAAGPPSTSLAVPLAVAALAFAGAAMWVFASVYSESKGSPARPTRGAVVLPASSAQHDGPRA